VSSIAVTVPVSVAADDGLVLVLTTNSAATGTAPAGFAQVDLHPNASSSTTFMTTQVFQKVATGDEGGTTLTVPLTSSAKATLQLVAYSGTSRTSPVRVVDSRNGTPSATEQTTPGLSATTGEWALEVWADKAAATRTWTPPAEVVERNNLAAGATAGEISSLVVDSGAAAGGGPVGGHRASVSAPSSRATVLTAILAPAG
jgi:hypothetical protein